MSNEEIVVHVGDEVIFSEPISELPDESLTVPISNEPLTVPISNEPLTVPSSNEPLTVEERNKIEKELNLSWNVKMLNTAADMFTPNQIILLTKNGRKNLGIYGIIAWLILILILGANLYGLIKSGEDRILVLVNLMIPSIIFVLSIEKLIASLLISFIKQFQ